MKVNELIKEVKNGAQVFWCTVGKNKGENHLIALKNNIWGVEPRYEERIKKAKKGDFLIIYSSQYGISISKILSDPYYDKTRVWPDGTYPWRVRISAPILHKRATLSTKKLYNCLRNSSNNPYKSAKAAGRGIGGPQGVFRKISLSEFLCILNRISTLPEFSLGNISYLNASKPAIKTRNIILYGPVGTGKTLIAKAICREDTEIKGKGKEILREIRELTGIQEEVQGYECITFHKSYSYEEFIEGIRPVVNEMGEINYVIFDGIFKRLCLKAITAAVIQATKEEKLKEDLEREIVNYRRIIEIGEKLQEFLEKEEINAREYGEYTLLKRVFLNWIREKLKDEKGKIFLEKIFEKAPPYLMIIDEINRGDPSRIFGELLTLIEDNKRIGEKEAMMVILPYSREPFGVPANLCIIGTMNTTDRSIALLDIALRRRFTFIEVLPDKEALNEKKIEEIELGKLLNALNERIISTKDPDHQLGHAFLMEVDTEEDLIRVWNYKIAPFLEEVFYSDPEGLEMALGPNLLERKGEVIKVKRFDKDSGEELMKALKNIIETEKEKQEE